MVDVPSPRRLASVLVGCALLATACGSDDTPADGAAVDESSPAETVADTTGTTNGDDAGPGDDGQATGDPPSDDGGDASFDEVPAAAIDVVAYSESGAVVVDVDQADPSDIDVEVSGLGTWRSPSEELPPPTIDLGVLQSGGVPPDGIPSIDDPAFHDASTVDYLAPTDPVVAIEIDGDARAYPLDIMIWHEIVNDTVGGVPVAIEYCPLCNSVSVHERTVDGRVLEFGVSGLLLHSSLVMYDRQTETLWSHFTGDPLYGELVGAELVPVPSTIVGFGAWLAENPDGLVLTRDTGAERRYGLNPYPGYDDIDARPFLFEGEVDGRYTAMTRVVGIGDGADAVAFPLLELSDARVVTSTFLGDEVVAFWAPGSTSALDGGNVSGGADVGATGVFRPVVDGRTLTFVASGDEVVIDEETGSTWNVFGEAVDGQLAGSTLEQITHTDTFWFAWIAFHPDSAIATP